MVGRISSTNLLSPSLSNTKIPVRSDFHPTHSNGPVVSPETDKFLFAILIRRFLCGQDCLPPRFRWENIPKFLCILFTHQFSVVLEQYCLGVARLQSGHCSIAVVGNVVGTETVPHYVVLPLKTQLIPNLLEPSPRSRLAG